MAHTGKKIAFIPICLFCRFFCLFQILFHTFIFGNVLRNGNS